MNNRFEISWKFARTLLFVLLSVAGATSSHAQLTMDVTHAHIQSLSISDLDFQNRIWLFTMSIGNTTGSVQNARIRGNWDISLADGNTFPAALTFTTQQFEVPIMGMTLTNLDIGSTAAIRTDQFEYSPEARNRIVNVGLASGLPAGIYRFTLELLHPNGESMTPPASRLIEFIIESPARIELLSPADGSELVTGLPLFQWLYQGNTPTVLKIGQLRPGDSREEALRREPVYYEATLMGQNSHQIEAGGVRPLEPGRYVWTVIPLLRGGAGGLPQTTEIWEFSISESAASALELEGLLNQLALLLGTEFAGVMEQVRNLNLTPTGTLLINGRAVSLADVQFLVNQLSQSEGRVTGVSLD